MSVENRDITRDQHFEHAKELLAHLKTLPKDELKKMYNGDFLLTWEHSMDQIDAVITIARIIEDLYKAGISTRVFNGSLAISIFRDKSTRTRFSFQSACALLGLPVADLDEQKSQVSHGETTRETANMISFTTEVIGIRDDLFIGEGNKYMRTVSAAVAEGHKDLILPYRPAIINLQCDIDHPTQSICDILHLIKYYGGVDKLKGKKMAFTWAYSPSYGKPLSVPQSIIGLLPRFGVDITLAHPKGYELMDDVLEVAKKGAKEGGSTFKIASSMEEAFEGADIVYPKSWAPVNVMEKRRDLLHKGKAGAAAMADLEAECVKQNAEFKDWHCTEEIMKKTKDGKALYMHCLPADVTGQSCKEGEVEASVFDRYRVPLFTEAENKLYGMAAQILLTRFPDVVGTLDGVFERKAPLHNFE